MQYCNTEYAFYRSLQPYYFFYRMAFHILVHLNLRLYAKVYFDYETKLLASPLNGKHNIKIMEIINNSAVEFISTILSLILPKKHAIEMIKGNRCTGKFYPINFVLVQERSMADPGSLMLMRGSRNFCQKVSNFNNVGRGRIHIPL